MAGRLRAAAGAAGVIAASLAVAAQPAGASAQTAPERALARAAAPTSELAPRSTIAAPQQGVIRRYSQRVDGLPVLGAEAVTVEGRLTDPILVADSTVPGLDPADPSKAISRRKAIAAARRSSGVSALRAAASAKLGVDPAEDRLAWEVSIPSAKPLADLVITVDAVTGDVLHKRDLLRHATGSATIFDPNPVTEQASYSGLKDRKDKDSPLLTSLLVPVTLERLSGASGCLRGEYVDARLTKKGKKVCAAGADFSGVTRSNNRFEALMAYYHIDRTRLYADSLGLSKPLRSKPQKVLADAIKDDNSFYSSLTHELVLGTGGIDDGEDADVIVHEYGHSLQDQAAPKSLQTREGATMGEGFGDYLAAAMSNLTTGGSPFDTCIFDWDGIPYSPTGTCGRKADVGMNVDKAERRCRKEIHCVGQVWSSTLFELREELGADADGHSVMDRVVLESNFMLTKKSRFKNGANALIAADKLLYGGTHADRIREVMDARKFL